MKTHKQVEIESGARSDMGRVRENNEDSFALAPEIGLFVLSDGMGGLAAGEIASRLTTKTVLDYCRRVESTPSLLYIGERRPELSETSNRLSSAIRLANREVHEAARQSPAQQGMGATVVALWLVDEQRMSVAHVGDSRAYRFRSGELEQLTQDHSFVADQVRRGMMTRQEAEQSKMQNVLLRALGVEPEVQVEVNEELLMEGDTLLLCSDGLTHEISDAQIAAVLGETQDPQEAADKLVELANQAGGGDNITTIVLEYAPRPAGAFGRIGRWFKGSQEKPEK